MSPDRRPSVFVSYSRANKARVDVVVRWLTEWGYRVWIDVADIGGGEDWRSAVRRAVEAADVLIVAVSRSSLESPVVEWEVELAEDAGKLIIPIKFGRIPDLETSLQRRLSLLNHISFADGNNRGLARLLKSLGGGPIDPSADLGSDRYPAIRRNIELIAGLLAFLQESRGGVSAVVLHGGESWEYYIQMIVATHDPEIRGEAVGNGYLEAPRLLSDEQQTRLVELGWNPPPKGRKRKRHEGLNFSRRWFATSREERLVAAGDIVRTFLDVYGHLPGEEVLLELKTDDYQPPDE